MAENQVLTPEESGEEQDGRLQCRECGTLFINDEAVCPECGSTSIRDTLRDDEFFELCF